jgi:hypothetical protein
MPPAGKDGIGESLKALSDHNIIDKNMYSAYSRTHDKLKQKTDEIGSAPFSTSIRKMLQESEKRKNDMALRKIAANSMGDVIVEADYGDDYGAYGAYDDAYETTSYDQDDRKKSARKQRSTENKAYDAIDDLLGQTKDNQINEVQPDAGNKKVETKAFDILKPPISSKTDLFTNYKSMDTDQIVKSINSILEEFKKKNPYLKTFVRDEYATPELYDTAYGSIKDHIAEENKKIGNLANLITKEIDPYKPQKDIADFHQNWLNISGPYKDGIDSIYAKAKALEDATKNAANPGADDQKDQGIDDLHVHATEWERKMHAAAVEMYKVVQTKSDANISAGLKKLKEIILEAQEPRKNEIFKIYGNAESDDDYKKAKNKMDDAIRRGNNYINHAMEGIANGALVTEINNVVDALDDPMNDINTTADGNRIRHLSTEALRKKKADIANAKGEEAVEGILTEINKELNTLAKSIMKSYAEVKDAEGLAKVGHEYTKNITAVIGVYTDKIIDATGSDQLKDIQNGALNKLDKLSTEFRDYARDLYGERMNQIYAPQYDDSVKTLEDSEALSPDDENEINEYVNSNIARLKNVKIADVITGFKNIENSIKREIEDKKYRNQFWNTRDKEELKKRFENIKHDIILQKAKLKNLIEEVGATTPLHRNKIKLKLISHSIRAASNSNHNDLKTMHRSSINPDLATLDKKLEEIKELDKLDLDDINIALKDNLTADEFSKRYKELMEKRISRHSNLHKRIKFSINNNPANIYLPRADTEITESLKKNNEAIEEAYKSALKSLESRDNNSQSLHAGGHENSRRLDFDGGLGRRMASSSTPFARVFLIIVVFLLGSIYFVARRALDHPLAQKFNLHHVHGSTFCTAMHP